MNDNLIQKKLKNIKTATLMILVFFILIRQVQSTHLEDYKLEISYLFMLIVLALFAFRVYIEVKNKLFEPKKYYLLLFFILASVAVSLFSWYRG